MGSRWQQDYIRFSGEVVAVENNPALPAQPCATCYLSYDHLGSVRMVTDGSGTVKAFHDYAPFGQEIPARVGGRTALWGGSDSASQRFTGQVRDTETGLDFFNARYLSSGMGRFMSVDPGNAGADGADPQTWNGYGYVRNTPGVLVDPSGMNDTNTGQPSDPFDPCWDPYSVGNDSPCWGVGGGVGGGSGGGGGGGGRVPSGSPTASGGGPWPPGSFPGGENLGLPPGMNIPNPFGVGSPNPFIFSACPQAGCFGVIAPILWTPSLGYAGAVRVLYDFLTGSGRTSRQYGTNSIESVDLRRSGGFQMALRGACASGKAFGSFNVSTPEAALFLPFDATSSPTGVQVGGYLGNYSFSGNTMNINIHNVAGANSFFYHGVPDRASPAGPFRSINQDFSMSLSNPCGK